MAGLDSAVTQVANLKPGQTYSRAHFIPAAHFSPGHIIRLKEKLAKDLSPVISRAREREDNGDAVYHIHTTHGFTQSLDLIVAAVVIREGETEL